MEEDMPVGTEGKVLRYITVALNYYRLLIAENPIMSATASGLQSRLFPNKRNMPSHSF